MNGPGLGVRLYLDEDVDVLLAPLLRARGFDVATAHDAGMLGKSDQEHLQFATTMGRPSTSAM